MSIVLVATILPKPESHSDVVTVFEHLIPFVHGEAGCELYALHQGRDRLVLIEKWSDPNALSEHGKSESMRILGETIADMLAAPIDIQVLQPVPAGEPALGVV